MHRNNILIYLHFRTVHVVIFILFKPTHALFLKHMCFKKSARVGLNKINSNIYPTRCNVTHFILSGNCSTCFGWYLHPSSGAQTTVSTASGICHTVTAICRYRGRVGTGLSVLWVACAVTVWQIPDTVDRVVCASDDGWRYHPKHVEQFTDINKLRKIASCWIYIGVYTGVSHPQPLKPVPTLPR